MDELATKEDDFEAIDPTPDVESFQTLKFTF